MNYYSKFLNIYCKRKEIVFLIFAFLLSVNTFSQILLPFKSQMNGKYGYINESGDIVISAKY